MSKLLIKNGTVILPDASIEADILAEDGKIVRIENYIAPGEDTQIINAAGLIVMPGLIDTQTHMREPGLEHKEDLESGTRGAVLGGVTGVFEMPNTNPPTTSPEALAYKVSRMQNRAWCDYAFYVGGTPATPVDWQSLEKLPASVGIKIFMGSSTGNLLVEEDAAVERILAGSTSNVSVHSEDEFMLRERKHIAEEGKHPRFHPEWRNVETALNCTKRLIRIAEKTGHKVHVLHISTAEEMDFLKEKKHIATVEVLGNHLTFDSSQYETLGTLLQMNPPIRDKSHQDRLWEAVNDGTVDILASDHAPHTLEEKAKPYPASPSGLTGVQTLVPMMLNHVNNGKLTIEKLADLMAHNVEKVFGTINKGKIEVGYDADFTIVDMNKKHTFTNAEIAAKAGWTALDGVTTKGMPVYTIIRGNVVMKDGELVTKHIGEPISFTHVSKKVA